MPNHDAIAGAFDRQCAADVDAHFGRDEREDAPLDLDTTRVNGMPLREILAAVHAKRQAVSRA